MRPISEPQSLKPGTTLYHSAFGFARVCDVGTERVQLTWERPGAHLPAEVGFDNLRRVYTLCPEQGFFHQSVASPDALARALHDETADALLWLLGDLGPPQRLRDVMDWLVGRGLFTPKTFVRWWGAAEAVVRADPRLSLEGEWLHVQDEGDLSLTQLEPDAVDPEAEVGASLSILEEDEDDDDSVTVVTPLVTHYQAPRAMDLGAARPPASSLPEVAHALAEALAHAHGEGRLVHPTVDNVVLRPDGAVSFRPTEAPEGIRAPSPATDVAQAAAALLEAALGRAVPPHADPAHLLPHLRHVLPDLPPTTLAPLAAALLPDPDDRPTANAWANQWEQVLQAEVARADAHDDRAMLHAGYDSHVGRVKLLTTQINQDCLWIGNRGPHGMYLLADGISISDAGSGEQASWLAVQSLARLWRAVPLDRVSEKRMLDRGLHLANRAICERALRAAGGDLTRRMPMGTTILAVATRGNRVHLAWLGDSRAYLIGPWGAAQLTADDNVSGERFVAWCKGETGSWNADGHALVRYLGHFDASGTEPAPFAAHHTAFTLARGERILLCSDGVTDYLDTHEAQVARRLGEIGAADEPDAACRQLVSEANARGGGDNISVVLIEHDDGGIDLW